MKPCTVPLKTWATSMIHLTFLNGSPVGHAKYSAVVRARRGVTIRSMVGSSVSVQPQKPGHAEQSALAKFMKSTTFSMEPFLNLSGNNGI